jgi:hypothetical protein
MTLGKFTANRCQYTAIIHCLKFVSGSMVLMKTCIKNEVLILTGILLKMMESTWPKPVLSASNDTKLDFKAFLEMCTKSHFLK